MYCLCLPRVSPCSLGFDLVYQGLPTFLTAATIYIDVLYKIALFRLGEKCWENHISAFSLAPKPKMKLYYTLHTIMYIQFANININYIHVIYINVGRNVTMSHKEDHIIATYYVSSE